MVLTDLTQKKLDRVHSFDNLMTEVERLFPASEGMPFRIQLRDSTTLFWNPDCETPEPMHDDGLPVDPRIITPDGSYALGYDAAGKLTLCEVRANFKLASYTADADFESLALSSDGQLVAVGDTAKRVHILWLMRPEGVPSAKEPLAPEPPPPGSLEEVQISASSSPPEFKHGR